MEIFNNIRNDIDLEKLKPFFKRLNEDKDYFQGTWDQVSFFIKNLVNIDLCYEDTSLLSLSKFLKDINVVGASFNKYSPNTKVLEHTDTELLGLDKISRCFIPLESNYKFIFSGICLLDGELQQVDNYSFNNKDIIFIPQELHSYKNLNDFDQYFMILDIFNTDTISKSFWENYFTIASKYYI